MSSYNNLNTIFYTFQYEPQQRLSYLSIFSFYGMLDQLVASKGRVFIGTWWSTLSGYVNRMRGYYIAKHKLEGYKDGTMESYYFFPVSDVYFLLFNIHYFPLFI